MTTRKAGGPPATGGRKRTSPVKTATTTTANKEAPVVAAATPDTTSAAAASPAAAPVPAPAAAAAPAAAKPRAAATSTRALAQAAKVTETPPTSSQLKTDEAKAETSVASAPKVEHSEKEAPKAEAHKAEVSETKAAEAPKLVEAPKPVEAAKPVEAPKPVEAAKPVEAPKPVEAAKPAAAANPPASPAPVAEAAHTEAGKAEGVKAATAKPAPAHTRAKAAPAAGTVAPSTDKHAHSSGLFDERTPVTGIARDTAAPVEPKQAEIEKPAIAASAAVAAEAVEKAAVSLGLAAVAQLRTHPAAAQRQRAGYKTINDQSEIWTRNVSIATRGVTELNTKLFDLVRTQTDGAIDLWRRLLSAGSLAEAVELHTRELRRQFETTSTQLKDIAQTSNRLLTDVLSPSRQDDKDTRH
ncbi:phasin family protein [Pseudochelatococcus contaminans]|uniref:Chemotaxis protein histidine kinase CheA n=1 Tax=Pseudochelatococcus contaminans TaxID=1538103 RepID=A0A7W5Z3U2_9HYPH|nr:phasin family protein [Pseudochelatococcus contaminans]MBB3809474.1 chemotaxis protein histidine kinase CheA [Pseudochelatococcus contaminans]